ncbi:hypothetical protein WSK_0466 [Novosphingobium sp. Rr 2-17]|uniref:GGDEF domain-containing protein n=1 Tax=Novosphingobium sp. Rr 2-17 TaxID=555793 RepID=UPI0002699B46|nr:sensor domain-containing diguanylate cyclase [Novosphingobium sp. Rr 2-17]EIZ81074.1 hypothetical protein WSK_0466 [Novosphingobium sp. Rr 2-17]
MGTDFNCQESWTLYGMLAESRSDIVIKTDCNGLIVHASSGIEALGLRAPGLVGGPHLLELVGPEARVAVAQAHAQALLGKEDAGWIEFPALTADGLQHWFEICFRALRHEDAKPYGAIAIMRSIDDRRVLNDKLFAATYTDPLTRLTNRGAFIAMLEYMLEDAIEGCLAMFSIDFFRTINMQHGQSVGDEVLVVFADHLRNVLREEDLISRIGSERFAVLLPHANPEQAEGVCRRVVSTLAGLKRMVGKGNFPITASAGVARITDNLDSTIERAEMALFVAKAKGRNRLEMERPARSAAA